MKSSNTANICDQLQTKKHLIRATIYPSMVHNDTPNRKEYMSNYVLAYNRTQNIHYQHSQNSLPPSLTSSITWNPQSDQQFSNISIQYQNTQKIHFHPIYTEHSVCIVQTFRNYMTPSMLYLCLEYYLSLGWTIILFDRKGNHHDIIQERYQDNSKILYYPFTVHELIYPERYSSETERGTEVLRFIHWLIIVGIQVLFLSWSSRIF